MKPLTRFTISLNFIATAFRIGDDAAWLPSPADRSPAQTEERGVRRFFSDASGKRGERLVPPALDGAVAYLIRLRDSHARTRR